MSADLEDAQAKLVNVRKAIDAVLLGGQKVSYEGREVTQADLESLQKLLGSISEVQGHPNNILPTSLSESIYMIS